MSRARRAVRGILASLLLGMPFGLFAQDIRSSDVMGDDVLRGEMFGCPGSEWPWSGEGPFVNFPAALAASPGGLVGTALALAFVPADLIEAGVSSSPQPSDGKIPRFAHVGVCAGVYLGKGLGLIVGSPFWALKQAFWNGPKRLFGDEKPGPGPSSEPAFVGPGVQPAP